MKRIIKHIIIVPLYLFLFFEGFIGAGVGSSKDPWDDLVKWARK